MLIALIVIIGLSLLILGHEMGHFLAAKFFKLKVDEFGFGFPPRIFASKKGETEYSLNWLPFGGFVKIAGENDRLNGDTAVLEALPEAERKRYFLFQSASRRALVTAAGVLINFIIGWLLISTVLMVGTPPTLLVSGVEPNSPAAKIGLREGDIILNYAASREFVSFVNQNRGHEITVEIKGGGQEFSYKVVPRIKTGPDQGALGVFLAQGGFPRMGFLKSLGEGFKETLAISWLTIAALYQVVKDLLLHGSLTAGVVGPVGIFGVARETGQLGLIYLVQLIALISINLSVINLIPFPALDGGRLFMIAIEKIRGTPISRKVEAWANGLGFAILMVLIALITVRDIAHLF